MTYDAFDPTPPADLILGAPTLRSVPLDVTLENLLPIWLERAATVLPKIKMLHEAAAIPHKLQINEIAPNVPVLSAYNLRPHRDDPYYGWAALWFLHTAGHVLHCQGDPALPTTSITLTPGTLIALHAHHDRHSVTDGTDYLLAINLEFYKTEPSDDAIRKALIEMII